MENCFNEMLEYGEAIKSSFVKGHVSDWPEKKEKEKEEETGMPEEPEVVEPETPGAPEGVIEDPVEEEGEL